MLCVERLLNHNTTQNPTEKLTCRLFRGISLFSNLSFNEFLRIVKIVFAPVARRLFRIQLQRWTEEFEVNLAVRDVALM